MTLGASFPLNTLHRVIGCTECDAVVRELSKQEYDALVAKQRRQLDSGELPSEVLATFANAPKRLARKTVGLVAAVFWALCLLAVAGALVGDPGFDASMSVIVVVIIAAALYPVVRAARGRAEVARYARAYRRASASRS